MANTINTRIVLRHDTKAGWEAVKNNIEKALLAGELGVEDDTGLFKIGKKHNTEDRLCTWEELEYANDVPDLSSVTNNVKEATTLIGLGNGSVVGDVGIVKAPLYEGATDYTYTAYVWAKIGVNEDGSDKYDWTAMDGNYSAENVYTSKKITLAGNYSSIGNYAKGKEINAGTSLQTILSGMLQTTIQPTKRAPTATISATGDDGGKETGDTYTKPTGTLKVTSGSYTNEGSATGVKYKPYKKNDDGTFEGVLIAYGADPDTATYTAVNTAELGNDGTVSMPATTYANGDTSAYYTDSVVNYTFSGKAHNEAGNIAKDNLGENSDPIIQIGAGNLTVTDKTVGFRGYRKMFCGCTSETLNSATIRGLTLKSAKAAKGTFEVTAPTGATQIVLALPTKSVGKKYTMTKAEMYTSNWEDYTSLFSTAQTIQVADKRGGENGLQNYNVYTYGFAALKANTRFQFTIAEANA